MLHLSVCAVEAPAAEASVALWSALTNVLSPCCCAGASQVVMLDRETLALECSVQSARACGLTAEVNAPPGVPQPQVRPSFQPAMQHRLL